MPNYPSLLRALLVSALFAAPAGAANDSVPYWASIRVDEVNMHVGPSEDYRINWVYRRVQLPLKVVRLKEGWRLVEDPGGARGWVLAQFLSRSRGAIVVGQGLTEMYEQASPGSKLLWRLEPGVVGKLGDCTAGWCRLELDRRAGFVAQDRLWGAGAP
jgi:SH3-like domain-containing protein